MTWFATKYSAGCLVNPWFAADAVGRWYGNVLADTGKLTARNSCTGAVWLRANACRD